MILDQLGFSPQDTLMTLLCPCFAAVGGFAHTLMLHSKFTSLPEKYTPVSKGEAFHRAMWFLARLLLSGAAGLVVALLFVGSLTTGPSSVARVFVLAVVVGYAAPKLWVAQERLVSDALEKKLEQLVAQLKAVNVSPAGAEQVAPPVADPKQVQQAEPGAAPDPRRKAGGGR